MSTLGENLFWRLLPGNPIFLRVVEMAGKRGRHAMIRIGYLGAMVAVTLVLVATGLAGGGTLTELTHQSTSLFVAISYLQLGMACLLAPVFTAGAITQEKDNKTYNVLLATPLSNAQIVLGSLVSRLFFVLALLASGIPMFLITQLFGGVTGTSILLSFMIAAATVVLTGSVAVAVAVIRVGTGKTIITFYIGALLYIAGVWMASWISALAAPGGGQTSWLTAMHPFLSLKVVLNATPAPTPGSLPGAGWLTRLWLCYPHYAYLCWTLSVSIVMVTLGTIFVRRSNARTRSDWGQRLCRWFAGGALTRKPRTVWKNPVAWREAATWAAAGGRSIMRWVFLVGGLAVGLVLAICYHRGLIGVSAARHVLQAVLWVELSLVVLVLCNVSASAITREREDGTLDLLLVTPITSRYYIWGKLRGLISFAAMLLVVPVGTALIFAIHDLASPPPMETVVFGVKRLIPVMALEGVLELALSMLGFCALAAMIALTMSLKFRRTTWAVITTVLVVGVTALGGGAFGHLSADEIPLLGPLIALASPYVAVSITTAPHDVISETMVTSDPLSLRLTMVVQSIAAAGGYAALVWGMYSSMVRSFDMTIRRQSR